ncbi:methyl-accepting chemotaxis protein [Mesorhizobium sp. CAU 1741]|uniref:methyl-accepting chemotaxis protein n=1 Tax=Mesorhizobium sp. CAU 1741 TaxID=3140366 RepID=UPI00325B6625
MNATHEGKRRLSPSTAVAVAAAAAGAAASGLVVLVIEIAPGSFTALAVAIVLASLLAGLVSWATARLAVRAELSSIAQAVVRLERQDFTTSVPASSAEAGELVAALQSCRATLGDRHKVAKAHAAVARLLGNAIKRLAEGDLAARITVDLPEPYRGFRNDFNGSMEALEAAFGGLADTGGRLSGRARAIGEAADELSRRATKLSERLDADLRAIDIGARRDPAEALRLARHTLDGVVIATHRNRAAAARFDELGRGLAREAERLFVLAGVEQPRGAPVAKPVQDQGLPAAAFPVSLGATALKLHR